LWPDYHAFVFEALSGFSLSGMPKFHGSVLIKRMVCQGRFSKERNIELQKTWSGGTGEYTYNKTGKLLGE
jgi:hypothetical protein